MEKLSTLVLIFVLLWFTSSATYIAWNPKNVGVWLGTFERYYVAAKDATYKVNQQEILDTMFNPAAMPQTNN